jgi:hypothetical protein
MSSETGDFILPDYFKKHKGKPIAKVCSGYLDWIRNKLEYLALFPDLVRAIEVEMDWRDENDSHFDDPWAERKKADGYEVPRSYRGRKD